MNNTTKLESENQQNEQSSQNSKQNYFHNIFSSSSPNQSQPQDFQQKIRKYSKIQSERTVSREVTTSHISQSSEEGNCSKFKYLESSINSSMDSKSNEESAEDEKDEKEYPHLILTKFSLQQQYQVQGGQKGTWTEDEDQSLLELVEKFGAKGWNFISSMLPGRVGKQCRERWHNHLDPNIKKQKWTLEEDKRLMHFYHKYKNKWSMIARHMPGRTDNTIKNRFNSALKKHRSFQEYIFYKQSKYEKALQRKSKGIYKKKGEDQARQASKQKHICQQTKKLELMKSIVQNPLILEVKNSKQSDKSSDKFNDNTVEQSINKIQSINSNQRDSIQSVVSQIERTSIISIQSKAQKIYEVSQDVTYPKQMKKHERIMPYLKEQNNFCFPEQNFKNNQQIIQQKKSFDYKIFKNESSVPKSSQTNIQQGQEFKDLKANLFYAQFLFFSEKKQNKIVFCLPSTPHIQKTQSDLILQQLLK